MTRVLVVGLGTIARTHLAVLSRLPSVEVVAGVDPAPTYDVPFPVFPTLDEGLALEPDLVVLATPTESHVALADVLLSSTSALVLSEKPLAQSAAEIAGLESRHSPEVVAARLKVAHHFAFSPEVEWAARLVAAHPEWGPPTRVVAMSTDAYGGALTEDRRASLVSSFVDSAPNQLSVASAFTQGWRVLSHADQGTRAVTVAGARRRPDRAVVELAGRRQQQAHDAGVPGRRGAGGGRALLDDRPRHRGRPGHRPHGVRRHGRAQAGALPGAVRRAPAPPRRPAARRRAGAADRPAARGGGRARRAKRTLQGRPVDLEELVTEHRNLGIQHGRRPAGPRPSRRAARTRR